jgi:uncharacterized protein (DUF608 family)
MTRASSLDRRRFLKLSVGSAVFAGVGMRPSLALAYGTQGSLYRLLVPEGATPAAKGIDANWLASLRLRESAEPTFSKASDELRYIGMPIGGIGCGTLYLGGDGRLWLWDVWYKSGEGIRPRWRAYTHANGTYTSADNRNGVNYFAPLDAWKTSPAADENPFPFDQGFALRTVQNGSEVVKSLDHKSFTDIAFRGSYPLARVSYADAACPLTVELLAHPVFIPLNAADSSLPATVLEYTLHNPGTATVEATVLGWLQNPVLLDSGLAGGTRVNQCHSDTGCGFLECRADNIPAANFAYASDYTAFATFEGTSYAPWVTTGSAFGTGPVTVPKATNPDPDLQDVRAVESKFVSSYLASGSSDVPTGTLTSPTFTISHGHIHFLLGGGTGAGLQVRLLDAADLSELRVATNTANSSTMQWRAWNVSDLIGRAVKIVVEDFSSGDFGRLDFDQVCFSDQSRSPEYVVYEDFERSTYAPWVTTGTCFGTGPIAIARMPGYQGDVNGVGQRVVNSHASAPGTDISVKDAATGTLVSPLFNVSYGYLHFLQGGGNDANLTRVRLLRSDNRQILSQTGDNSNAMTWRTWDLRNMRGWPVKISIEDLSSAGWGNVGVDQIVFSTNPAPPPAVPDPNNIVDYGTIGIAELGDAAGRLAVADHLSTALPWVPGKSDDTGGIGRTLTLAPGESATVRFVVAWHFPALADGMPESRREYANRFSNAYAVASYVASNYSRLTGDTRLWVDVWKDSSLPYWFLDRAMATAATLASANCYWFTSGRFYGTEGVNCCAGTCTHVWFYAQTLARMFPELERGMRQNVDLNPAISLSANGAVNFRGEYSGDWAWDGQCGVVLRCYREHLCSSDLSFLTTNWAAIKLTLDFLIGQDGNNDGVSEGRQPNTLDADFYGRVPEHIGLYAAALKAGREMATAVGATSYAATCDALASQAMARLSERFVSSSDYGDGYYTQLVNPANIGQLGFAEGCHIDQAMGECYARMIGLERVTDAAQCRAVLRSIWRFNYSHDLTNFLSSTAINQGSPYQLPGDAGLLICTFPNDGNQWTSAWQSSYFATCMTGYGYEVGAHCLAEGLIDEGLTIVRALYDRYHPAKRNPFNEIECSDHYARAMASYGAFLTVSGFRHSGPDGLVAFAPVLGADAFKSAFTTAQGWGRYQRTKTGTLTTETITLKRGSLRLWKFECIAPAQSGYVALAKRNGVATAASFSLVGSVLRCTLPADLVLAEGETFAVSVQTDAFAAWVAGTGLTGADAGFNADPDHDGISNGIECVIGGEPNPANPDFNSCALLPVASETATELVFSYRRTSGSAGLNPVVEFCTSLDGGLWTPAVDGTNATITVLSGIPTVGVDTVQVSIPKNGRPKLFARLRVTD